MLINPVQAIARVEDDNVVLADTPTYMGDAGDYEVYLTGRSNGEVWLTFHEPDIDTEQGMLLTPDEWEQEEVQGFAAAPPFQPDPTLPTYVWFPNYFGPGRHGYDKYPPGVGVTPPSGYVGVLIGGSNNYYPAGYQPRTAPPPAPATPPQQPRTTIGPVTVIGNAPVVIGPHSGNITIQMPPGGGTTTVPVSPPPNPAPGQTPQVIQQRTLANGTVQQIYPNGTVVWMLPNGSVVVWPADPSQRTRYYPPGTYPGQP